MPYSTGLGTAGSWWSGWRTSREPEAWRRAYTEINEIEEMLADSGAVMVKIWLQIDKETQLKRFLKGRGRGEAVEDNPR